MLAPWHILLCHAFIWIIIFHFNRSWANFLLINCAQNREKREERASFATNKWTANVNKVKNRANSAIINITNKLRKKTKTKIHIYKKCAPAVWYREKEKRSKKIKKIPLHTLTLHLLRSHGKSKYSLIGLNEKQRVLFFRGYIAIIVLNEANSNSHSNNK